MAAYLTSSSLNDLEVVSSCENQFSDSDGDSDMDSSCSKVDEYRVEVDPWILKKL